MYLSARTSGGVHGVDFIVIRGGTPISSSRYMHVKSLLFFCSCKLGSEAKTVEYFEACCNAEMKSMPQVDLNVVVF